MMRGTVIGVVLLLLCGCATREPPRTPFSVRREIDSALVLTAVPGPSVHTNRQWEIPINCYLHNEGDRDIVVKMMTWPCTRVTASGSGGRESISVGAGQSLTLTLLPTAELPEELKTYSAPCGLLYFPGDHPAHTNEWYAFSATASARSEPEEMGGLEVKCKVKVPVELPDGTTEDWSFTLRAQSPSVSEYGK